MILHVTIEDKSYPVDVPESILQEAEPFFARMDSDMDQGWQMGRYWVETVAHDDRCRIAAERLVGAVRGENRGLAQMMAGYIMSREPTIVAIRYMPGDEVQDIELVKG